MAGHSKWANIQHRKGRQDAARSKRFAKLAREVTVAAKLGDPDPDKNPRLRLAVREAKANSVPKDVIERAISKAVGPDADQLIEMRYEGYGPSGVAVIVETMTDNKNRTASTVRAIFSRCGGNLAETGAVSFLFDRCGEITFSPDAIDSEKLFDVAVDAGADDIESFDDAHIVYTAEKELASVTASLESEIGEPVSARMIWRPKTVSQLNEDDASKVLRLLEMLDDEDDVQVVTSNIEFPETMITAQ
ncbi:MAG: YebC/PmpR family DNA-binding transcriptional regulator [Rhodobacteraceae bacterium]|nr:YebC/PmpR family DNA-binding transcriptional regulator [Paracoccaceae bacterium]MCY4197192.1 YebC/PmpR family DNA-binding transcriptional regulator [Paracoccaceae bacterium]MCY4327580.1 YebC/PmpR family DNA-binding transcriptional regulator [Paracoccaceae bacterium]